jgi:hypothetical protein
MRRIKMNNMPQEIYYTDQRIRPFGFGRPGFGFGRPGFGFGFPFFGGFLGGLALGALARPPYYYPPYPYYYPPYPYYPYGGYYY